MPLYTTESVERVKDAIDMVELVGTRTELRRVGSRYTGLCPFHDERTPSFSVNAEHGLYHCFGCGASGDAIRFVQETEVLDFKGAIEFLSDRYGIELRREQEDPRAEERRRRRDRLLALIERAVDYYARYLWESAEAAPAREYLASRGLGEQILREFRVGYSPKAWDRLVGAAQADGYGLEEVAAAGLGQRGQRGGFYDRFRGRIMFPLADPRGRVLGFGARALAPDQQPKYLNTSENELYHKGRQLFGLDRARGPAAKAGRVLVVEGYTDVLALHEAGITETVAIMGTALTQEQLAELSRVATTVYLALDADSSGQEAMLRTARMAASRKMELRVVEMPEGSDPAELVAREGGEGFGERMRAAISVPEFEARRVLAAADLGSPLGRARAIEQVQPLVAEIHNPATREELVRFVSDRLDIPIAYLLTQPPTHRAVAPDAPNGAGGARAGLDQLQKSERVFLGMCVKQAAGAAYLARAGDEHFSSDRLRAVRDWLVEHPGDPLADLPADPALSAAVTEIAMLAEEIPSSESVLSLQFLELERHRIERAIRAARQAGDLDGLRDLSAARARVRAEIEELMGEAS